ncbi:MAG: SRPBCC family protein [Candidatus Limnocylindria bacterium]
MTRISETVETTLPIEAAFAYLADFANSQEWDPGVASAERIGDGPISVGARYRLEVRIGNRVAPMEYRVSEIEPPFRIVLVGAGSGVSAVDTITFTKISTGTRVDYAADITLGGIMRLIQPFLRGTFANIAANAVGGMQRQLDARAAETRSGRS